MKATKTIEVSAVRITGDSVRGFMVSAEGDADAVAAIAGAAIAFAASLGGASEPLATPKRPAARPKKRATR